MAVFRYKAMKAYGGEYVESGIVVGSNEKKVRAKLKENGFGAIRLDRISGIRALWKRFSADFK